MASLYKRGNVHWLAWYESGVLKRESLGKVSQEKAERLKLSKEYELKTGKTIEPVNTLSFGVFTERYLRWHEVEFPDSNQRVGQIINDHLIPYFGKDDISNIEPSKAEEYKTKRRFDKTYRKKHVSPETINKELRTLNAVINKAVEWNEIQRNTIKSVKPVKKTHSKPHNYFTTEQLELIYEADPVYADVYRLLANTGMRRAEAMNLRWTDIKAEVLMILSQDESRTKSAKWRQIPISEGACAALTALCISYSESEHLLPRIDRDSLSRAFAKAVKRAGLEGSLHDLRHTFISHLVMKGVPLRTVQVLAGHSSYKTTEQYAHLAPDHLQDAVSGLSL